MGAAFEHCTTRPVWLNETDHTITFNKQPNSGNYVFAWGNHRGRRKKKKAAANDTAMDAQKAESLQDLLARQKAERAQRAERRLANH
jgi:hypothetical protein